MLAQTLQCLERLGEGFVSGEVLTAWPPSVNYSLTLLGETTANPLVPRSHSKAMRRQARADESDRLLLRVMMRHTSRECCPAGASGYPAVGHGDRHHRFGRRQLLLTPFAHTRHLPHTLFG